MEKLFGRAYDSVGSTSSDFIIKTRGQVKVQWGNKFIDLIKDGKLNCDSDILNIVPTKDKIGKDGIYYVEEDESVILVIDGKQISLFGEIGTMYVSFLGKQETKGEEKYQALTNIGFIYKTMEEASASGLPGGIVYVEDSQKLYIVLNGQLIEYQVSLPNPITQQVVIQKSDSKQGALIIKGTGIENSLIIGDIQIYSKSGGQGIINSPNSINICILDQDKIIIRDNITCKPDVIFDSKVISDYIQSKSASENFGFRLYMDGQESYLEVDNLRVRNPGESNMPILYPKYWSYSTNIIKAISYIEDQDQQGFQIKLLYENTYTLGDKLYLYVPVKETNHFVLVPLQLEVVLIVTENEQNDIYVSFDLSSIPQKYQEVGANLSEVLKYLVNQTLFKVGNNSNIKLPILRYSTSSIDLLESSNFEEEDNLKSIHTRVGDIKELNLELTIPYENKEEKITPEIKHNQGIYSDQLISLNSLQYLASLFAPIFRGGPNKTLYPKYEDGFEIPKEDESKKIVTSEWVKKWLRLICPPGTIVQWAGSSVPEGWALCNGSNGTPNLVDKFIKGGTSAGATGGHKEITLTIDNLPSHSHSISGSASTSTDGSHRHGVGYTSGELGDNANNRNNIIGSSTTYTDYAGSHSHTVDLSGVSVSSTGNNKPINIEPQYYTLMYIMKLDY